MMTSIDCTAESYVYLLRHGDSRQDGIRRYIGQMDTPLNDNGRNQARQWRDAFAGIPFNACFCSDLQRSIETMRIITEVRETQAIPTPGLREISMGAWENRPMEEVRNLYPDAYERRGIDPAYNAPPGGESFSDLHRRVIPLFEDIMNRVQGPILVVGHAGVNRVILCHLLGMPLQNLFRIGQDYGCLNCITRDKGLVRVRLINHQPWIDFCGCISGTT
jgi:broad specificity phosphatase PhoE